MISVMIHALDFEGKPATAPIPSCGFPVARREAVKITSDNGQSATDNDNHVIEPNNPTHSN